MSANFFAIQIKSLGLNHKDQEWYPKWIFYYASYLELDRISILPIQRNIAIDFSRYLLSQRVPAWQRLQAVRAIACYAKVVAIDGSCALEDVIAKLSEVADQERVSNELAADRVHHTVTKQNLDPSLTDSEKMVQEALRLRHYSLETEKAYLGWIKRFQAFLGQQDPLDVDETRLKEFLSTLAVEGNVAASTQNQALSALLFMYEKVLGRKLEFLNSVKANKPAHLPMVLSRKEISKTVPVYTWPKSTDF